MTTNLADFDDAYEQVEVPERKNNFEDLPDGTYDAKVDVVDLKETKDGTPMLSIHFVVLVGKYSGRKLFKSLVFTRQSLPYVKADLALLGFVGKPSDLQDPEKRAMMLDRRVRLGVKTKADKQGGQRQNVYINKSLDPMPKIHDDWPRQRQTAHREELRQSYPEDEDIPF